MDKDDIIDSLGDSPEENLRIENELLKLKMQAELGVAFMEGHEMPPALENTFLKNILAFHQNNGRHTFIVWDKIGNPNVLKAPDLDDNQLLTALAKLEELLRLNELEVTYHGSYDQRTKYTFLTEEFLQLEMPANAVKGEKFCITYEDFHPDHEAGIKSQTERFIKAWFNQTISRSSLELSDYFILPERKTIGKQDVVLQMQQIFEQSGRFADGMYDIIAIDFQLMENNRGMGYSEGALGYRVRLAIGETKVVSGPFKLYFSLEDGQWQIVHLIFPGFVY